MPFPAVLAGILGKKAVKEVGKALARTYAKKKGVVSPTFTAAERLKSKGKGKVKGKKK